MQKCGQHLWDDYMEQRPGAAKEMEMLLNDDTNQTIIPGYEDDNSSKASPDGESSNSQNARTSEEQSSGQDTERWEGMQSHYDPRPKYGQQEATIINCDPENRWLLVCMNGKQRPTCLSQLNMCTNPADKELFEELRRTYFRVRSKWSQWSSLKRVQAIRFVQVGVNNGIFVTVLADRVA